MQPFALCASHLLIHSYTFHLKSQSKKSPWTAMSQLPLRLLAKSKSFPEPQQTEPKHTLSSSPNNRSPRPQNYYKL